MFSYERIQTLNQLELCVYRYVIAHTEAIEDMTIRQLSNESHVSSTTILRFLKKMGFEGFSDFKYALKHRKDTEETNPMSHDMEPVNQFFLQAEQPHYREIVQNVAKVIAEADTIIMFGIGTSGSMAQYGSRLFANYGLYTVGITDPFQPQPSGQHDYDKTILICLSVSGRSEQVLRQARFYSEQGATTIAITADPLSSLGQLVDYQLDYNLPEMRYHDVNFTSQIPVVYLLEKLGMEAGKLR